MLKLLRTVTLPPAALLALAVGCGGDETAPTEDHTPEDFTVLVDGTAVTAPYELVVGQTVRVRVQFFNAAGDNLDDVEGSHFAGLTFSPTALASATRVSGHNYQFDLTGNQVGSGTVTFSFGHDEAADEVTLESNPVNVVSGTGGNPL